MWLEYDNYQYTNSSIIRMICLLDILSKNTAKLSFWTLLQRNTIVWSLYKYLCIDDFLVHRVTIASMASDKWIWGRGHSKWRWNWSRLSRHRSHSCRRGSKNSCQQNVLSEHSPVFNTMLYSKFKESAAKEIILQDKKATDVVEFLKCFYPNMEHPITGKNI